MGAQSLHAGRSGTVLLMDRIEHPVVRDGDWICSLCGKAITLPSASEFIVWRGPLPAHRQCVPCMHPSLEAISRCPDCGVTGDINAIPNLLLPIIVRLQDDIATLRAIAYPDPPQGSDEEIALIFSEPRSSTCEVCDGIAAEGMRVCFYCLNPWAR